MFMPHVTLLGQLSQEADLIKVQLEALSAATPVFHLDMSYLSMSNRYFRSVILNFHPSPQLELFYRSAVNALQVTPEEPFVPHLSLLYSDFEWVKKQHAMEGIILPTSLSVRIHEVVLMETEGQPESWKEIAEFQLKPGFSRRR